MFRRSSSTEGEKPLFSFSLRARSSTDLDAQPLEIARLQTVQRGQGAARFVDEPPDQAFFRLGDLPKAGKLPWLDGQSASEPPLFDLCPDDVLGNPGLEGQTVGEPVRASRRPEFARRPAASRRGISPGPRRCSGCDRPPPGPAGTLNTAATASIVHRSLARRVFRMNVSGSSPGRQDGDVDVKPLCHQHFARFAVAPWPAASGSKLSTTLSGEPSAAAAPAAASAPCRTRRRRGKPA